MPNKDPAKRLEQDALLVAQDENHAEAVKHLVEHPLDIPSLERQVWGNMDEPFLSAGYQWTDKPHRVLRDAITEIRALRAFIKDMTTESNQPISQEQLAELTNKATSEAMASVLLADKTPDPNRKKL